MNIFKDSVEVFVEMRRLKAIDKEIEKYNRINKRLNCQLRVVNEMLDRYREIYGEDLRTVAAQKEEVKLSDIAGGEANA